MKMSNRHVEVRGKTPVFQFSGPACSFILYTTDQVEGFRLFDLHCIACWSALYGRDPDHQEVTA